MASLNPFMNPNAGNKPWVDKISKNLQTQLAVTIDAPPVSIFEIPKIVKSENLEAYVPQRIGLGPNHHFQPELYHQMEQNKLTTVKKVLKPHQIYDCQQQIVEKVREIVPLICACHYMYLDFDYNTLAWLFTIDGIVLIDQLNTYSNSGLAIEPNDLIMLENQIPLIVLKEICKALLGENAQAKDDYLESEFRVFCESLSPFTLSNVKTNFSQVNHLLDYMYHSIVNNETPILRKVEVTNPISDPVEKDNVKLDLVETIMKVAILIPGAQPFLQIVEFIKQHFAENDEMVDEIKVPTVSQLWNISRVRFRLSPTNEGIRNIKFVNGKDRVCYVPLITLNINSEVVLRNLVAYEKLMAGNSFASEYGLELTTYVDFLCGIIDNVKDVKLLREGKVIAGDLGDEAIVKMFNGMQRSHGNDSVETELNKTLVQLNKVYESMPRVWCQKLVEKQLRDWSKIIKVIATVLGALIVLHQGSMKIYGPNPPHIIWVRNLQNKLSPLLVFFIGPKGPLCKHYIGRSLGHFNHSLKLFAYKYRCLCNMNCYTLKQFNAMSYKVGKLT